VPHRLLSSHPGNAVRSRRSVYSAGSLLVAAALHMAAIFPAEAGEYLLGSGDRLRISADEWPTLSGEFSVAADGTLSLPIVGLTQAGGESAAGLAKRIGQRVSEKGKTGEPVNVHVEIIRYRPFFIMGDVQRPGEYEFQPGMTVLKAVTKAGGFFRLETTGLHRLERDSITARGIIVGLRQKSDRLRVRLARLQAQLEGRNQLKLPEAAEKQASNPDFKRLVEQEQAVLNADLKALEQKISAQQGAKIISEQEIGSLSLQIGEETTQLNFVKKEADKIRSLQERGLASSTRLLDLDRNVAQITSARQGIQTQILRARLDIHRAEQKILELRHEQKMVLQDELKRVSDELHETSDQIKTQTELLLESDLDAPRALRAAEARKVQRQYRIVRDDAQELDVGEATAVAAGDLIKVERLAPSGLASATQ
jgi:exopolysaccharide production protein ExoF